MASSDSDNTSSSGSDSEDPKAQRDNAYMAQPGGLAALRNLPVQRLVNDRNWYGSGGAADFQARMNATRQYNPNQLESSPRYVPAPGSETSSIAATYYSRSTQYSTQPPSLMRSNGPSSEGTSSARTSNISAILPYLPGLGEDGFLEESVGWQCPFSFLGCGQSCEDIRDWDTHCQSHFRGHLPKVDTCPFGCGSSFRSSSGEETWQQRRAHVIRYHQEGGRMDYRPNSDLIQHLWRKRVITEAEEQELRRYGRLSGRAGAYLRTAGIVVDRRRNRRPTNRRGNGDILSLDGSSQTDY